MSNDVVLVQDYDLLAYLFASNMEQYIGGCDGDDDSVHLHQAGIAREVEALRVKHYNYVHTE